MTRLTYRLTWSVAIAIGRDHRAAHYSYELRDEDGGVITGDGETVSANVGDRRLVITGGRLTVNGADHGPLSDGDTIVVTETGAVLVNGQVRLPQ